MKFGLLPSFFEDADATADGYRGLELLASAVLLLDRNYQVAYADSTTENLFELSKKQIVGHTPRQIFGDAGTFLLPSTKPLPEKH